MRSEAEIIEELEALRKVEAVTLSKDFAKQSFEIALNWVLCKRKFSPSVLINFMDTEELKSKLAEEEK